MDYTVEITDMDPEEVRRLKEAGTIDLESCPLPEGASDEEKQATLSAWLHKELDAWTGRMMQDANQKVTDATRRAEEASRELDKRAALRERLRDEAFHDRMQTG